MTTSLQDRLFKTEAIVLSRMDYGEADRIITIYTPDRGKMRVIAKGIRKPTSRFGPHLEYFNHSLLLLARGRELDVVSGAETIDYHTGLRGDLEAFGHASHLAELLLRLTEDRQENLAAFDLLKRSLGLLAEGVDPFIVSRHFELALLTLLGYRPELFVCLGCQEPIGATTNAFSARLGGLLCPNCQRQDGGAEVLSVNAQKFLRLLERDGLSAVARLRLGPEVRQEVEHTLGAYLRHVGERDFQSLRVWQSMRDGLATNQ